MNISRVRAKEIFDSRGYPTLACLISLEDGTTVEASVPSDWYENSADYLDLNDTENYSIADLIKMIESVIAPILIGREPDVSLMDAILLDFYKNSIDKDKKKIRKSALLAVSMAICKAQAIIYECEVFELITELFNAETVLLPFPFITIVEGGTSSDSSFPFKEILLVPVGAQNFKHSFEQAIIVSKCLSELLKENKKHIAIGDKGGINANFSSIFEPFDFIVEALKQSKLNDVFVIGINAGSQHFFNQNTGKYLIFSEEKNSEEMLKLYKKIADTYPLFSIEDGFSNQDEEGWKNLTHDLGKTLQIIGNDLFSSEESKILRGLQDGVANSIVIKPNIIGTVTEILQAIAFVQELGANVIISHSLGETNETFITDLVVGTSAGQIKLGGCSRGERIAKYNRLIEIEDNLTMYLLDQID